MSRRCDVENTIGSSVSDVCTNANDELEPDFTDQKSFKDVSHTTSILKMALKMEHASTWIEDETRSSQGLVLVLIYSRIKDTELQVTIQNMHIHH